MHYATFFHEACFTSKVNSEKVCLIASFLNPTFNVFKISLAIPGVFGNEFDYSALYIFSLRTGKSSVDLYLHSSTSAVERKATHDKVDVFPIPNRCSIP